MHIDVEKDLLVIDKEDNVKCKKITGHSFVGLIGLDNFKRSGDWLLIMHCLLPTKIDPKWLKRGDFAEMIVKKTYEKNGVKCTTYDKKEINYDNFNYEFFGGLIDIELINDNTLVEVKSKSMKDYDYICQNQPMNEVYQGLYYGRLRKYERIIMEWIFFDEETEKSVFEGKKPNTLQNLKRLSKTYFIDKQDMDQKLVLAKKIVDNFRKTLTIPLSMISDETLKQLGLTRPPHKYDELDLPF